MVEIEGPLTERFKSHMKTRESRIALSRHLRETFRYLVVPYTTSGSIKDYMESHRGYLHSRRPVDILRSGNGREIDRIHFDLIGIDTAAFA